MHACSVIFTALVAALAGAPAHADLGISLPLGIKLPAEAIAAVKAANAGGGGGSTVVASSSATAGGDGPAVSIATSSCTAQSFFDTFKNLQKSYVTASAPPILTLCAVACCVLRVLRQFCRSVLRVHFAQDTAARGSGVKGLRG